MANSLKIKVNGLTHPVTASLDTPLLYVLHNELHLHGPRFGCGLSQCGACTVHMGDKAIRSCVTPVSEAAGRKVTTIEGLSRDGSHPVQRAWAELDVVQCGYCQSGQIMAAAALLARNADPTDADVDKALAGNICRCGTYPRIRKAVHRAAALRRTT